jgi:hypothetical protein
MSQLGRFILVVGLVLVALGLVLTVFEHMPILNRLGRLPGDIRIKSGDVQIYIPLTTCIILSLILSLVIRLFTR